MISYIQRNPVRNNPHSKLAKDENKVCLFFKKKKLSKDLCKRQKFPQIISGSDSNTVCQWSNRRQTMKKRELLRRLKVKEE